jgi:hypothetical protein
MDLFHKLIALIDKNSENISDGDYLQICNTIQELRESVKPPSFLLDQNRPMYHPTQVTDWQPVDTLPSDPDTAAQRDREQFHQRWREQNGDEECMYPGLNAFLQELDEEWTESVEPGFYYPPNTYYSC